MNWESALRETFLYRQALKRLGEIPRVPPTFVADVTRLLHRVHEESKYILHVFPEYTPHDPMGHTLPLFSIAERVLGTDTLENLNGTELWLLVVGLYCHDWGMAVSEEERTLLDGGPSGSDSRAALLPGEPDGWARRREERASEGEELEVVWREYVRETHALRSARRLADSLRHTSAPFSEAAARLAHGHTLDESQLRNIRQYPYDFAVFGQTVNLAALARYIRIADLLDIGEDRTPYALWHFVEPRDRTSRIQWKTHSSVSAVAVSERGRPKTIVFEAVAPDVETFATITDLRTSVDRWLANDVEGLREIGGGYALDVDTRVTWHISTPGFEPIKLRFDFDRDAVLGLLSEELYEYRDYVFVRELLQNSIDAIDVRSAILHGTAVTFGGAIEIELVTSPEGLRVIWTDNGIGMDLDTIRHYFAVIGRSWYREKRLTDLVMRAQPISRFGIGILSCFSESDSIRVSTRRDPTLGGEDSEFVVEIPAVGAHFRVERYSPPRREVGTSIELLIRDGSGGHKARRRLLNALRYYAGFVQHTIRVRHGAETTEIESLAGVAWDFFEESRKYRPTGASLYFQPDDVRAKAELEAFRDSLTQQQIRVRDSQGEFEAIFRFVLPMNSDSLSIEQGKYLRTLLRTERSEFLDWSDQRRKSEISRLYVKGVLLTPHFDNPLFSHRTHPSDHWFFGQLHLNVLNPDRVLPNPSRTQAINVDRELLERLRTQMARSIWKKLKGSSMEPVDVARALGSSIYHARLTSTVLVKTIPRRSWPIPVIAPKVGLEWRLWSEVCQHPLVEAPVEIRCKVRQIATEALRGAVSEGLERWEGPDLLALPKYVESKRRSRSKRPVRIDRHPENLELSGPVLPPWAAVSLDEAASFMRRSGFAPTSICLLESLADDPVPFVARVFTPVSFRRNLDPEDLSRTIVTTQRNRGEFTASHLSSEKIERAAEAWAARDPAYTWNILALLLSTGRVPHVLKFPDRISKYAAIGTLAWNISHPHVEEIVDARLHLALAICEPTNSVRNRIGDRWDASPLSLLERSGKKPALSEPSRHASVGTVAIWGRLLRLASEIADRSAAPLDAGEYLRGSIGRYANPSEYRLESWRTARGVGRLLN